MTTSRIIITKVGQTPNGHALYTWSLHDGEVCLYADNIRRGRDSVETRIRMIKGASWKFLENTPTGKFKWRLPSLFGGDAIATSSRAYDTPAEAMGAFADLVAGFDRAIIEECDRTTSEKQ